MQDTADSQNIAVNAVIDAMAAMWDRAQARLDFGVSHADLRVGDQPIEPMFETQRIGFGCGPTEVFGTVTKHVGDVGVSLAAEFKPHCGVDASCVRLR